jgi:hypothetical protein
MAFIYRHIRLDKNEPFYIGISSNESYNRAYCKYKRNSYWNNIVKKTNYKVEIMLDNITWEEAIEKEIEFIKLYGRKNNNTGILCNLTNGGEGTVGYIIKEETRKKRSIALSGVNNPNYNKPFPDWQKEINRKARLGVKHSNETINKIRIAHCKKVINTETNQIYLSICEVAKIYNKSNSHMTRLIKKNKFNLKFL